jgi:alkylation response protein AidB-like acyl-CoA dehydrogenase
MLNNSEVASILSRFPKFEDTWLGLSYAPHMPKHMVKETREVIAIARKFNEDVANPLALKLDRLTHKDPDYLPWELIEEANRWRFYTMWIPKMFGGHGYNMPSMSCFSEEVASACVGIMNVIGVHYLAVAGLTASGNTRLTKKILREVVEGEKSGKPCVLALATTEPGAGTDVEEVDLVDKGKVTCQAKRVKGGYIVNGTKVFISMGHVSSWTVLYAYEDTKHPSETTIGFVVKTGTKGFSFGSHENKMGQRVCPASLLIFEDCFIPDDQVLFSSALVKKFTNKPARDISQRYCDYVVSATRPGVCAFGIGVARGAFETALHYASTTCVNGHLLINQEWAQCMLAEMHKNVILGRLAYTEANNANSHRGLYRLLQSKPVYYYLKVMPRFWFDKVISPMLNWEITARVMGKILFDVPKPEDQRCCSGWASVAKITGTDLGVKNCQMAIEIMGQKGLRQDAGVEKMLRDIKLLQIYEGTNQLNRLNAFKCLIAPQVPQAQVFEE